MWLKNRIGFSAKQKCAPRSLWQDEVVFLGARAHDSQTVYEKKVRFGT
jgi:hypothetical protein